MYKKVDNGLDFVAREKEVLDFWKENHIFEKASKKRRQSRVFVFRRSAYGKRTSSHRAYSHPCYEGYYSPL